MAAKFPKACYLISATRTAYSGSFRSGATRSERHSRRIGSAPTVFEQDHFIRRVSERGRDERAFICSTRRRQ